MPDMYVDVDTAVTVPVNLYPLTDDTDFTTQETTVAYNAAGMALKWNFQTTAGVTTQTAVTPTTGGVYDWLHNGGAMYEIEIPASGGASINNDTEGVGWFTGICDGVLSWAGPRICFRAAALNDALIDGGDLLDVNLTEIGGAVQSATDLKDFADAGYDPATNKVQGVVLVDTTTTNTDMRGTDGANTVVPDAAGVAPTAVEIRQEMDANSVQLALITTIDGKVDALPSVSDILTTAMTESYAANGVIPSLAQILFETRSLLATMTRSGINVTVYKLDGTTVAETFVFDDAVNPAKLTRVT